MIEKPTWMWAKATALGGIVATFIDSLLALTFLAERPALYWMLFQPRQTPLPRMTEMPSLPSTTCLRSTLRLSAMRSLLEELADCSADAMPEPLITPALFSHRPPPDRN